MSLQVLVATMHQQDAHALAKKMNLQSEAVFANQADTTDYRETEYNGFKLKMITTQTKGVGLNRNLTLMYADADICLLSDDDLQYVDGYAQLVEKAFAELPDADGIIFNLQTFGDDANRRVNQGIRRIRFYNCLNYGAPRLAFRRVSVLRENIMFHRSFGGGTPFSCGEDSLFIWSMIRKKMKLYTYPVKIADVDQTTSTWFQGYTKKFLYDTGLHYRALSKFLAKPLCWRALLCRPQLTRDTGLSRQEAYNIMKAGIKGYKKMITYQEQYKDV